jgi:hypothetical protein
MLVLLLINKNLDYSLQLLWNNILKIISHLWEKVTWRIVNFPFSCSKAIYRRKCWRIKFRNNTDSIFRNLSNLWFWRILESTCKKAITNLANKWDFTTISNGYGFNSHGFAKRLRIIILKWLSNVSLARFTSCLLIKNSNS